VNIAYRTKAKKLAGTDYREVYRKSYNLYKLLCYRTKRRPYVRSAYFNKEKIFLELFWQHVRSKTNHRDKLRRLKYFPCAIELLKKSRIGPVSNKIPDKKREYFYRFAGITQENELFFVQIKEDTRTGNKWLMSVFPTNK